MFNTAHCGSISLQNARREHAAGEEEKASAQQALVLSEQRATRVAGACDAKRQELLQCQEELTRLGDVVEARRALVSMVRQGLVLEGKKGIPL